MLKLQIGDYVNADVFGICSRGTVVRILPQYTIEIQTKSGETEELYMESVVTVIRDGVTYGSAAYCPQCGNRHPDRSKWPIIPAEGKTCMPCTVKKVAESTSSSNN